MIRVQITAAFEEDELGPAESYVERFVLPEWFARDAADAHAYLLLLLSTQDYLELSRVGGEPVPSCDGGVGGVTLPTFCQRSAQTGATQRNAFAAPVA
ncbi:MAG: hypothetical protein FJ207_09735 [Gemmatimonadetes bacterium]|nr:hypothetical protein [Gemmatimonadota bacterium]